MAEPFPKTDWDSIRQYQDNPDAMREAFLEQFCESYQLPLASFLIRSIRVEPELAEELAQEFIVERVLTGRMFRNLSAEGKFRSWLRTSIRNFVIDYFRKKKLQPLENLEELVSEATPETSFPEIDRAWGIAIFQNAIQILRQNSNYWDLFQARVLTQPPVSYEKIIDTFGYDNPEKASNALMTAKRQFNRIIQDLIQSQIPDRGSHSDMQQELHSLRQVLSQHEDVNDLLQPDTTPNNMNTRGISALNATGSDLQLIDEARVFTNEADLHDICAHLLRLRVSSYVEELGQSAHRGLPVNDLSLTFGEFCDSEQIDFEIIRLVKDVFNRKAKSSSVVTPSKINVMMTFVCIAKTLCNYASELESLTRMPRKKADEGIAFFASQSWLPDAIQRVFRNAS